LALPPPNTLQPAILLSSELSLIFRLPVLLPSCTNFFLLLLCV
jgi:hypothetical protein